MELYAQKPDMGYAASGLESLFDFLNVLVAETPDMYCHSTKFDNDNKVNCHVCCHGLAAYMKRPYLVAVTGRYAGCNQHSWLEFRVPLPEWTNPVTMAVLDVYPVNSAQPVLLVGGWLGRGILYPPYRDILKTMYEACEEGAGATMRSSYFKGDVRRMAETFRDTQTRLGLPRPVVKLPVRRELV